MRQLLITYLDAIDAASSLPELDAIVERAASDENIDHAEFEFVYCMASEKGMEG